MGAPAFSGFLGIDWSGARVAKGIAVAEAGPDGPPRLIPPPDGRRWTRGQVLDFLIARSRQERLLAGIDCAFSLPVERAGRYVADGDGAAFRLWELVEAAATPDCTDYYGVAFAKHPAYAADFWVSGKRPDGYSEPHRATEWAARAEGLGAPESPYKLIGAKQVGAAGLAGMRVLRAVRRQRAAAGAQVAIWPFEVAHDTGSIVAEIYPRLFIRLAGYGNRKVRPADLNAVLGALGCPPMDDPPESLSDHDTDALIAAAGMRAIADNPRVWAPDGLDETARRQEGWIVGVGAGLTGR